ncbi:hypothetical protein CAF53_17425 [Sphingobium sp. LB126]|uniref:SDR family NAD(P)-dependent oxidoreductase n=1 Tax=Sphingobium sp. LB126 TaxID=1983755 RepID=UPI000CAEEB1F|nr:SDR family NAD(P)-dependent oxidoreductase [Sphingobium sp. LB126]PJG46007.1 hypothetical protein CAF53_17425 [Sphingobium sp. LB126]
MTVENWFEGRVAVVTGGGNGIGRAHALALGRHGAKVVVNDLGGAPNGQGASHEAADAVVAEIRALGGEAVANHDNVADPATGAKLTQCALDHYGRVDVVIPSAGIVVNNRFEDMTADDLDRVIDVHLKGSFFLAQSAFRQMRAQGYGRFVFTGSGTGMFGHGWMGNYAMAKAGIVGLSHIVAIEGAPHGIVSNVLMPNASSRVGVAMGSGFRELPAFAASMDRIDFAANRKGDPGYSAALALYLASDRCARTRGVFSYAFGRYGEVPLAVSRGWQVEGDEMPGPAEIEKHWDAICRRDELDEPADVYDEYALVLGIR